MPIKYYRLRKNLPTFKEGEIFYLSDMGNLLRESDNVAAYSWSTIDKFPNILTDWFEEIKEPTRWKPERYDEEYYYLENTGWICSDTWRDAVSIDHERFEIGNCFQTKEEAERVVEYLKALAVVRGDGTSNPARNSNNWHVNYDIATKCLYTSFSFNTARNGTFGLPYFATEEDARRSIETHRNEWLTIFGIKEEE